LLFLPESRWIRTLANLTQLSIASFFSAQLWFSKTEQKGRDTSSLMQSTALEPSDHAISLDKDTGAPRQSGTVDDSSSSLLIDAAEDVEVARYIAGRSSFVTALLMLDAAEKRGAIGARTEVERACGDYVWVQFSDCIVGGI
jgi:hypothetical protein